jgi:hypothetical protein
MRNRAEGHGGGSTADRDRVADDAAPDLGDLFQRGAETFNFRDEGDEYRGGFAPREVVRLDPQLHRVEVEWLAHGLFLRCDTRGRSVIESSDGGPKIAEHVGQ